MSQHVLITGSAGRLGRAAVRELVLQGFEVCGFDVAPTLGLPASHVFQAKLDDIETLDRAMAGVDVLIHLAATPDDSHFPPMPGNDNFLNELVPNNIVGSYRVLESARKANVRKVILASTGQVVDGHIRERNLPVVANVIPRPRYLYACTKVFLESLGRVYAEQHGMSVLAVRLGWCPRDRGQVAQIAASEIFQDRYLSPGDAGRFFACAVRANWARYEVVYAFSKHLHQLQYDPEPARVIVGFEAQDRWPTDAEP